jgi:protein-tyrosine phosphatase
MLREMGVPANKLRMLRSFDPRSAAHTLDVEDPVLRHP